MLEGCLYLQKLLLFGDIRNKSWSLSFKQELGEYVIEFLTWIVIFLSPSGWMNDRDSKKKVSLFFQVRRHYMRKKPFLSNSVGRDPIPRRSRTPTLIQNRRNQNCSLLSLEIVKKKKTLCSRCRLSF